MPHEGLKAAIVRVLGATWQPCWVHWTRNALAYVSKGQHTMVAAALRQAFQQPQHAAARTALLQVAEMMRARSCLACFWLAFVRGKRGLQCLKRLSPLEKYASASFLDAQAGDRVIRLVSISPLPRRRGLGATHWIANAP